jgi:hypothetical protein
MTDNEAAGVIALEQKLVDWMKKQEVSVAWSIIALGISAARLIHGVSALQGDTAACEAAGLLDRSIANALALFNKKSEQRILH